MKIINRAAFLQLPAGIVYAKFQPMVFENIDVKGDTWGNDWVYHSLFDVEASESAEYADRLFHAMDSGESFALDFEATGRDGFFDEKQLFAVFEKEDVEKMIQVLMRSVTHYPAIDAKS